MGARQEASDYAFDTPSGTEAADSPCSPDTPEAWLVVAGRGVGVRRLNMAAHPDQVWIELSDRKLRVTPEQLDGAQRADRWQRIVAAQPRYAKYQAKTDRVLPVIRLIPARVETDVSPGIPPGR